MTDVTDGVRAFASLALELLDAGETSELRLLLASTLVGAQPSTARPDAQQLKVAALSCALGVDADALLPTWNAGFRESHLSRALLSRLREQFVNDPAHLQPARKCLSDLSITAQPLAFIAIDHGRGHESTTESADQSAKQAWISYMLTTHAAARSTSERTTLRVIYWARAAGMTQRQVADSLHKPQTYVYRQLQQVDEDPTVLLMTPRELNAHFLAGHIDRSNLLSLLAAYPYEPGSFPEGASDWAYIPGSFDELSQLAAEGYLSEEELDVVLAGVEAMAGLDG